MAAFQSRRSRRFAVTFRLALLLGVLGAAALVALRLASSDAQRAPAVVRSGEATPAASGGVVSARGDEPATGLQRGGTPGQCAAALTRELAESAASGSEDGKTLMLTVANANQLDFFRNWAAGVKALGLSYALVAAVDDDAAAAAAAEGFPCFRHQAPGVDPKTLAWGGTGWQRMTWQQVLIVHALLRWDLAVVASDLDVAWLQDPQALLARHPAADVLFSHDGAWSRNPAPRSSADDLEADGNAHYNLNTGVYMIRPSDGAKRFMDRWAGAYNTSEGHDQQGMYPLMRANASNAPHPSEPALHSAADGDLWLGVLPPYASANSHSYFVSKMHQLWGTGLPTAVHATWTYGGAEGKKSRMRESQLWHDAPEYYAQGSFVAVDLQVPAMPEGYNLWQENEPQIRFHLDALQRQLEQAAVGMAVARATGRAFIMPQFVCFCERIWHGVVRCRLPDTQELEFPNPCPADYYFNMERFATGAEAGDAERLAVRESSFLENPRTAAAIKDSQLALRPAASRPSAGCERCGADSATECAAAAACTQLSPAAAGPPLPTLEIPAGLNDAALAAVLAPHKDVRVLRLSFDGVQTPWAAFGGFRCASAAQRFDAYMEQLLQEWCCRHPDDAKRLNTTERVKLSMTQGKQFFREGQLAC